MSTIILKQFSYVRRLEKPRHDWLYRRRSAYAVRQCMDASGGTPYMQESSSTISSRNQSISNQKGMMKHRYLLYVHDKSVTFQVPCFSRYPPFNALSTPSTSITNAFPPESWETPVQHKLFQYNMTYDKITPHFTNRSASIIQFYA